MNGPPKIASQTSGTTEGAGVWVLAPTISPQTFGAGTLFTSTEDGGFSGAGARMNLSNTDISTLYPASSPNVISSGFSQYGIIYQLSTGGVGSLPSNTTLGPGFTAGTGSYTVGGVQVFTLTPVYPVILAGLISSSDWTSLTSSFGGHPDTFLAAISPTIWAQMSVAQVKAIYASVYTPNPGGACDANPGTPGVIAYCAITFNGKWNDGSGLTP